MTYFKKILQFLSFEQQIPEINFAIDGIHNLNNMVDAKENIDKKYRTINELKTLKKEIISNNKEIFTLPYILFVLINSMSLNLSQKGNEKNKSKII